MAKLRFFDDRFEMDSLLESGLDTDFRFSNFDFNDAFGISAPSALFKADSLTANLKADFFPNVDYTKLPDDSSEGLSAPELLTQGSAEDEGESGSAQEAIEAPVNTQLGFEPIDPNNAMDWDEPLNTNPTFTSMHVFSTDDIVGTFEGLTQGDIGPGDTPIIDFSATPKVTNDGVDLFPINSEFGFIVTDFDGAVDKDFEDNPEYEEGWAGDLTDAMGNQIGLVVSDAKTDTFSTPATLGTWLAGLGGNTVKASTEHYSVMQEILSDQMYPDDPNAVYQLDDNLKMIGGEYDGMFIADILDIVGDSNGDGVLDLKDVLIPNESTITEHIAAGDDYSVTLKDDGKLLYRWGNTVKRPNDIRIEAELELPDEWKSPDPLSDTPDLNPLYRVTSAELVIHHTITNNPNDQVRPEDYENESAIGTLPEYEVLPDGKWVSVDGYFAGNGDFYPAGTVLRDPALATLAEGSTLDQIGGMSEDLHDGFTNAWFTTMNREPFEPELNADGTEYITGPRWRLQPDKYGQDLPSVVIPEDPSLTANPTNAQVKYEVGMETQTVLNLLDWEFPTSPLEISAGWLNGAGTVTENGVTLSDNFDVSIYIKGDVKPATIYSTQLVMSYEAVEIFDFSDTITGTADDDFLVGQGDNTFAGGEGADLFVVSYGAMSSAAIQSSLILDFEVGVDMISLIDLDVTALTFDTAITQNLVGTDLFIALNGFELVQLEGQTDVLGLESFQILNTQAPPEEIFGTEANDLLRGDANDNIIYGLGGDDRLFGYDGDDVLDGGDGNNLLWGGEGADQLIGGAGTDRAMYNLATEGVSVSLETGGTAGEALGDTFDGVENLSGSAFDDTLEGDAGANFLVGYAGNDTLLGGAGNDRLYGYAGDDVLDGGLGNDLLLGSAGADMFQFSDAAFGKDAISGFEDGVDMLDFTALGLDFGDFAKSQVGANTVLTLLSDPAQTVTLYGVDESLIDAADFYDGGMI